ncbi:MAG: hypothetical protein KJ620_08730 [Candidatus Edwardsbacteria bacterium]|nr:hypothetical protein [Candidatus Edwardsbacteria bacterium]MBU1576804.1 hypothetical protein [Candidatus Edwardsbacteria bacterium]MBU2463895.1 hypothetical protein [Candidatus Edwardsbacteria bacterium]MBU2593339.1 hypothetical protein [Candidatus Edwardsbacteria bacterium]
MENITQNQGSFKDRSSGLKAFGVVLIVIGGFNLLLIPLVLLGSIMSRTMDAGQSAGYWVFSLLVNLLTYLFLGGIFLGIGIGSIRLKRWVRPVLLSIGWVWLLLGLMVTAMIFFVMPKMMGTFMLSEVSDPSLIVGIVIMVSGAMSILFMVLLPALLIWFYSQSSVKQTLEAKDPGPAWTDACPPPVLAISLFYGVNAVLTLLASFLGVSFIWGSIITGLPAVLVTIFYGLILAYICYAIYRLDSRGWWTAVISTAFGTVSSLLVFSKNDPIKIVALMGQSDQLQYAQEGISLMLKYQGYILWLSAVTLLGYLLYIKKYFKRS